MMVGGNDEDRSDGVLEELEARLGYAFADRGLLRTALTHRSHTAAAGEQNETLEFLGDSVVGLVVTEMLVRAWPRADEGRLSRRRASLVNAESLAGKATGLGLGPLLVLGRGEEKSRGREKKSILAGTFEAIVGAVFLDGGFPAACDVVGRLFSADVSDVEPGPESGEWKTRLQELSQRLFRAAPEYSLRRMSGPDHAREFASEVIVAGRVLGEGAGSSKKLAEQAAARMALEALAVGTATGTVAETAADTGAPSSGGGETAGAVGDRAAGEPS